ncbi:MAG: hypothetical protein GXY03_00235 [Solirubrobacterales bacterium]|nr:hypothetical protein [Solirubrobacterales bacterium]
MSGRWVHADCADTPIRPPVVLDPADRRQLLDAAERARLDGWQRWEADEFVCAVARRLGIAADARAVAAAVAAAY